MRYYSSDYRANLEKEIIRTRDSVGHPNYTVRISSASSPVEGNSIKNECLATATDAQSRIAYVMSRLGQLSNELANFYASTDNIADSVYGAAQDINQIITEASNALLRIDNVLNGVGQYHGQPVTSKNLKAAGFKNEKYDEIKETIRNNIIEGQKKYGCLNFELTSDYLHRIIQKLENNNSLSQYEKDNINFFSFYFLENIKKNNIAYRVKSLPILNDLYKCHVLNRYDEFYCAADLPDETRNACIAIYEFLNPSAKKIVDVFFERAVNSPNCNALNDYARKNVEIIKYDLYTADSKLRFLVLSYLPELTLTGISTGETAKYDHDTKSLFLNMHQDPENPSNLDCSFFHEFGHALDDLLCEDMVVPLAKDIFYLSTDYRYEMLADFRSNMKTVLSDYGYTFKQEELSELLDFIISKESINISTEDDPDYYKKLLPRKWTKKMKNAYSDLRDYYGYRNYIFEESGEEAFYTEIKPGFIDDSEETIIAGDLIGALTNNKLGSVGDSHAINPYDPETFGGKKENSRDDIKNVKALHKLLKKKSYWARHASFISIDGWFDGHTAGTEFFAESFDDRIHGVDQSFNREIFPTAIDRFEKDLDEAVRIAADKQDE